MKPLGRLALDCHGCVWHAARALGRALRKLTAQEREQWQDLITLLWEALKTLPPRPLPLRGAVVYLLNLWPG